MILKIDGPVRLFCPIHLLSCCSEKCGLEVTSRVRLSPSTLFLTIVKSPVVVPSSIHKSLRGSPRLRSRPGQTLTLVFRWSFSICVLLSLRINFVQVFYFDFKVNTNLIRGNRVLVYQKWVPGYDYDRTISMSISFILIIFPHT